jgi:hypothetical protein
LPPDRQCSVAFTVDAPLDLRGVFDPADLLVDLSCP